jgi:hypothetical protein
MFGGVEWLRREHRLVVLVRSVECSARSSRHCECVAELVYLCRQSCVNSLYLETSSLGLLLPLPDFINTDLK